jgi:predicted membrane-bound spermidine synthase
MLSNRTNTLLLLISLLSGFSALVYQVIWQRVLSQEVGVDAISVSLTVSIFMIGLALGVRYARRIIARFSRHPVALYAVIELGLGIFGFFSVPLIRALNRTLVSSEQWLLTAFLANLLALLLPTFLMGLTSPVLIALIRGQLSDVGKIVGKFYGANVLGAGLGAIFSGLFAIELFGLSASTQIAAGINLALALLCALMFGRGEFTIDEPKEAERVTPAREIRIAAVLLGFGTLALEMLLFRTLAHIFSPLSFIFPCLLCVFLAYMALGEYITGTVIDRLPDRRLIDALIYLFIISVWCTVLIFNVDPLYFSAPAERTGANFGTVVLVMAAMLIPVIPFAGFFPLLVKCNAQEVRAKSAAFSSILLYFTIGNALGSLLVPLFLVKAVGTIPSMMIVFLFAFVGVYWVARRRQPAPWRGDLKLFFAASLLLVAFVLPYRYFYRVPLYKPALLPEELREDHTGIVMIGPKIGIFGSTIPGHTLETSRAPTGTTSLTIKRIPFGWETWNFSSWFALDPGFRPRRVLVIGLGGAYWLYGLLQWDFVEQITVVELSDQVVEAVHDYSAPEIRSALSDKRVVVRTMDGRRFVNTLDAKQKFDLIQVGTFDYRMAGSSNLYSSDFFRQLKHVLSQEGVVATAAYRDLVPTALDAFRHGYHISPGRFFFFADRPLQLPPSGVIQPPASFREKYHLRAKGLMVFEFDRDAVRGPVNTDDHPVLEHFFHRVVVASAWNRLLGQTEHGQPAKQRVAKLSLGGKGISITLAGN